MRRKIGQWLALPLLDDPIERQLAPVLQLGMIGLAFAAMVGLILPLIVSGTAALTVAQLAPNTLFLIILFGAIWALRRGHFNTSLGIVITALMIATSYSTLNVNLLQIQLPLLVFVLPLILAAMVINRRTLFVVAVMSIVVAAISLSRHTSPESPRGYAAGILVSFIVVFGLFAFLLGLFGRTLRKTIAAASALAISNQRLFEDARAQRQQLEVTLTSIGDAVIATDAQGQITFINRVAAGLTGWTAQAAENQPLPNVFRVVNEETRAPVENPVDKVMREKVVVGLANHTMLLARDGREIPIDDSGAPIQDDDGGIAGVVLVFRDVSERKRAEEQGQVLQGLTAALSEALTREQVADVIVERGLAAFKGHLGTVCLLSDDGESLLIYNRVGIPEESYQPNMVTPMSRTAPLTDAVRHKEIVWVTDRATYFARYPGYEDAIIRNGTQASANVPLIVGNRALGGLTISFPDPRPETAEDRAFLLAFAGYCAQALERASLYEAEADARREAEEANNLKLKFLAMISHELRTPLTSIKGFASSLLAEDVQFAEKDKRHFIHIIDEEADRLTDLVEQLLDLSQLQAGTLRLKKAPTTFEQIVRLAQPRLDMVSEGYPLTLTVSPLPDLIADAERVAQVLVNLVANAAKYSPEGTQITLTARQVGDQVQVDVEDQGRGIRPEDRERVFEAFRQIDKGDSRQRGAGLGLAISRGIIDAHSGRIWVAEHQEPGTIVSFVLPLNLEAAISPST